MQILLCNGNLGSCCNDPGLIYIMSALKNIMDIIQVVVPILLIITASIQLAKLVRNPEDKNGLKKVKNMTFAAVIVFFVPVFVNALFGTLGDNYSFSSCWESASRRSELSGSTMPQYIDPTGESKEKSKLYSDPSEYQKGKKKPKEEYGIGNENSSSSTSSSSSSSSSSSTSSSSTEGSNTTGTESSTTQGTISGADVVAYARQFIGQEYERGGYWNGEKPYTPTDCVGFVKGVYKHFGVNIPSNTSSLYNSKKFTVVTGQPVKAGDIVIYAHHRALITGNKNQVVHAMGEAYGVGQSKNYKSCGAGDVVAVVRVNKVY